MKSIIGVGNALTDILAVLPNDSLLKKFHLPVGSMQLVDEETGGKIWQILKEQGVQYVAGGSAANAISGTSIFGMPSGFIGKVGDDELGSLFKSAQEVNGIKPILLKGKAASGRAMVFITPPSGERTFADYLGAALELCPEDLKPEYFKGYDYLHIEGYLVQNQELIRRAVEIGKSLGMTISLDLASYNIVESNNAFLHDVISHYVDIVFANELEAQSFTKLKPELAVREIAKICKIAVVKIGKQGSLIQSGSKFYKIKARPADIVDATGAGDIYAAGFLFAHANDMPLEICGEVGSIISAKVVEVVGPKVDVPRWKVAKQEIKAMMRAINPDL
ncbi:MAG: adenosine kinase [Bacteroidales bacterium]|jgi:sugar/nucleoside kinase (ribokinase family)|nr:adenosine kinase [Bacteroidales bacterium]